MEALTVARTLRGAVALAALFAAPLTSAESIGEGTQRKSLEPGARSIMARALLGECAQCSDAELSAIAGVVFNRWASRCYGPELLDVLLYSRKGVWAFTAFDPRRADGENVWSDGVGPKSRLRARGRILDVIDATWQRWGVPGHTHNHYYHPNSMKPRGSVPSWARGRRGERIGAAVFLHLPCRPIVAPAERR